MTTSGCDLAGVINAIGLLVVSFEGVGLVKKDSRDVRGAQDAKLDGIVVLDHLRREEGPPNTANQGRHVVVCPDSL